ncbi:Leucine-, glutamate- and lysine-rich protein 1 [Terramyces sp. JEL0728]|nr:Leucine-, glutamate- and lysine-rich protein 1 [Terramyces sp. JEL0728]
MTPPQEIRALRPLPEEILAMSESDTACQFCGISYLIQSKYDKMEKLVKDMQNECQKLGKYAEEYPGLIARLDELEDERKVVLKSNNQMNTQLEHFKQREKEQRTDLDSRNREISELAGQLLNLLAESITAAHKEKLDKQREIDGNILQGKTAVLNKEIEQLKSKLDESNAKSERLAQDIQIFKKEQADHLSGQRLYTQGLQSNCLELENRVNTANREIMELSMERAKLDQERRKLLEMCNELKEREYTSNSELEKKVLMLQGENVRLERELETKVDELQKKLTASQLPDDSTLKRAHQALAKKDEQMVALEKTIRELNTNLTNGRIERTQIIEAHQSRIKQLQEKFLEDLKKNNDSKVEVEFNLRKSLAKEHEIALANLKESLDLGFNDTKNGLVKQIELLKSHNINIQLKMEEKWNSRERDMQTHLKELSEKFISEKNTLVTNIRDLNKKIYELANTAKPEPSSFEDQLKQYQTKLSKKDMEIAFLKDTVRVECEERMGLVAMVAKLQRVQSKSQEPIDNVMEVESVKSEKEKPKQPLSQKDAEFFKLIQNANLKNSKRLAKQKIK